MEKGVALWAAYRLEICLGACVWLFKKKIIRIDAPFFSEFKRKKKKKVSILFSPFLLIEVRDTPFIVSAPCAWWSNIGRVL